LTGDDLFIPVIQYGSSNCFEFKGNREVSEKNWGTVKFGLELLHKNLFTKDEIYLLAIDFGNPSSFGDFPFKARGRQFSSQKEATNWFYNGIKNAMPLEQYVEYGNTCMVFDWSNANINDWNRTYVKTTKELIDAINNCSDAKHCSVKFQQRDLYLPKIRRKRKEQKQVQGYWVVTLDDDGDKSYLNRKSKRGFKYCGWLSNAKKFKTEKDAARYIGVLKKSLYQFEKYNFKTEFVDKIAIL